MVSHFDITHFNPGKKTILCLPDIKASSPFIAKVYERQLNLILVLKEKWLEYVDCSGALGLIVVPDITNSPEFTNSEEIITKVDAILERFETQINIDYVVAFAEQNIELLGFLTDHYRASGISSIQAQWFRDKYTMKQRAKEAGIKCPLFALWSNVDERKRFYKELLLMCQKKNKPISIILKPRKRWGAEGINRFSSIEALEAHMQSYAEGLDDWLLEEYISGDVFHVDTVVKDGRAILYLVEKYGVPLLDIANSQQSHFIDYTIDPASKIGNELLKVHQDVVKAFGLGTGMTHIEFFVEADTGEVILCEAAARPPGMDIPKLHEIAVERNDFSVFGDALTDCEFKDVITSNSFVGLICFTPRAGKLIEVDSLEKFDDPEIVYKEQNIQLGTVFRSTDYHNELGRIYIKTESEERCISLLKKYAEKFNYQVTPC